MNTGTLTFTRFIAAICVVIFHYGIDVYPFNTEILSTFFKSSNIFVSYFFFLSGFVMIIAYNKQIDSGTFNKWHYWIKRFARIYPIYITALLFLIAITLYFKYGGIQIKELFLNIFLIQSWHKETAVSLNYPGWSLSVEMFFYLMFPFLVGIIKKFSIRTNCILYLTVWVLSQYISIVYLENHYHPLIHINTFWGGLLSGRLLIMFDKKTAWIKRNANYILIISLILLVLILGTDNTIIQYSHDGLLMPVFSMIIIGLIYSDFRVLKLFTKPIFVHLGDISYGIYILQYPVTFLTQYINDKSSYLLFNDSQSGFYVYLAILIILSSVAYYLVEVPTKKLILSSACP